MSMISKKLVITLLTVTLLSFSFLLAELNNDNDVQMTGPFNQQVQITGMIAVSGPNDVVHFPSGIEVVAYFASGTSIGERIGSAISVHGFYDLRYVGTNDPTINQVAVKAIGQTKFAPVNRNTVVNFQFRYNDPHPQPIYLPVLPNDPLY